jgi:hypothetical protein
MKTVEQITQELVDITDNLSSTFGPNVAHIVIRTADTVKWLNLTSVFAEGLLRNHDIARLESSQVFFDVARDTLSENLVFLTGLALTHAGIPKSKHFELFKMVNILVDRYADQYSATVLEGDKRG